MIQSCRNCFNRSALILTISSLLLSKPNLCMPTFLSSCPGRSSMHWCWLGTTIISLINTYGKQKRYHQHERPQWLDVAEGLLDHQSYRFPIACYGVTD